MAFITKTEEKSALRREVKNRLAQMTCEERQESDRVLFRRLTSLETFQRAENLFLFCGVGTEPETLSHFDTLLVQGKMIYLPRCLPGGQMELRRYRGRDHLVENRWHIPEPALNCPLFPVDRIEFALIPALCYDRKGHRLGHGGGYYDRFLAKFTGPTAGFCRDILLQEKLPTEPHDRRVDVVLTESRMILSAAQTRAVCPSL